MNLVGEFFNDLQNFDREIFPSDKNEYCPEIRQWAGILTLWGLRGHPLGATGTSNF